MNVPRSLTLGTSIAPHLTLRSVLGEGASAIVFEAFHERLQALVAVKVPTLDGSGSWQTEDRLVREARICARLEDPHIPRVYDIANLEDGRPYIVMEKVTGPTLGQHLAGAPWEIRDAVHVARELLEALKVVHAAGIVHRDLKPENVILQQVPGAVPAVRLLDFGIAHVHLEQQSERSEQSTVPELILGTPGYMAPEQVNAEAVDARTDLYSLGIVMYQMLAGSLPLKEETVVAQLGATVTQDIPYVRDVRPDCPRALADIIRKATRRAPNERYQSAHEMALPLAEFASSLAEAPKVRTMRYGASILIAACTALALLTRSSGDIPGGTAEETRPKRAGPPKSLMSAGTPPRTLAASSQLTVGSGGPHLKASQTLIEEGSPEPDRRTARARRTHPKPPRTRDLVPTSTGLSAGEEQIEQRENSLPAAENAAASQTNQLEAIATAASLPPNPY